MELVQVENVIQNTETVVSSNTASSVKKRFVLLRKKVQGSWVPRNVKLALLEELEFSIATISKNRTVAMIKSSRWCAHPHNVYHNEVESLCWYNVA